MRPLILLLVLAISNSFAGESESEPQITMISGHRLNTFLGILNQKLALKEIVEPALKKPFLDWLIERFKSPRDQWPAALTLIRFESKSGYAVWTGITTTTCFPNDCRWELKDIQAIEEYLTGFKRNSDKIAASHSALMVKWMSSLQKASYKTVTRRIKDKDEMTYFLDTDASYKTMEVWNECGKKEIVTVLVAPKTKTLVTKPAIYHEIEERVEDKPEGLGEPKPNDARFDQDFMALVGMLKDPDIQDDERRGLLETFMEWMDKIRANAILQTNLEERQRKFMEKCKEIYRMGKAVKSIEEDIAKELKSDSREKEPFLDERLQDVYFYANPAATMKEREDLLLVKRKLLESYGSAWLTLFMNLNLTNLNH